MSGTEEYWPAPAKLNLMLRVLGRRPDGYHELQTVFQFLELGDTLRFRCLPHPAIHCSGGPPGVPPEHNLAVRAARLLQRHCKIRAGVAIELDKRLPQGGGLGGGSSDAATTLVVLNRLWNCGLELPRLARLGLQLGADVPIFIHGHAAWAEGVGEQFQTISPEEPWYLVIHPGCAVSTAEIFSDPDLTRNARPIKIRDFLAGQDENTIQPLVRNRHPEVARALDFLDRFSRGRLTGTGSCVFARFDERSLAEAALRQLPDGMEGFVARGCNHSPLHGKIKRFDGAWPSG